MKIKRKKKVSPLCSFIALSIIISGFVSTSSASVWTNATGNGNWFNAGNWTTGWGSNGVPSIAGNIGAVFDARAPLNFNFTGADSLFLVVSNTSDFSISGGDLTYVGDGLLGYGGPVVINHTGGAITQTGGGAGCLIGHNASGTYNITGGTLRIQSTCPSLTIDWMHDGNPSVPSTLNIGENGFVEVFSEFIMGPAGTLNVTGNGLLIWHNHTIADLDGTVNIGTGTWPRIAKGAVTNATITQVGSDVHFTPSTSINLPSNPAPTDGQTAVLPYTMLEWTPSPNAESQKVYFGTASDNMVLIKDLDAGSNLCQPVPYLLALSTRYFWRVDTVIDGKINAGNTWSFTTTSLASRDINSDGWINITDLILFVEQWLNVDCISNDWCHGADFNYSNEVDLTDFSLFAAKWLENTVEDITFDFETGDMQGWKIVDGAFGMFVCDREFFHNSPNTPYNKQGTYFLSSLETSNYTPNDAYTGIAESPVFELSEPEISFLVGGGNSSSSNYIALCTVDNELNEQEVYNAYGADTEVMQRINWDVPELIGQKVFVRLVDQATSGWGHVTFDDFSTIGVFDPNMTARRWSNLPGPVDFKPVQKVVTDLMATYPPEKYLNGQQYLNQIGVYQQQLFDLQEAVNRGSATQAELDQLINQVKNFLRDVLIANPLVSGQPILYIVRDQYHPVIHHNTATFKPNYDNEYDDGVFRTGGAMKKIDFGNGGTVTTLIETLDGIVRDPEVYFDGSKILFAKRNDVADSFHIYEINSNGTGLRQITSSVRVDDLDPMYLPDDSIVFSSTREPKYVHCNVHIMCNLYRMEPDGANIHQISKNTLFDYHPSLTPDGRIIYTRWEYVDRNFGDAQGLWTCNPDGTNHAHYFGNNTFSPAAIVDPKIIPGTQQVICTFTSCHDRPWGAIAIVDRRLGVDLPQPNKPNPVKYIWPKNAIDLCGGWDGTKAIPLSYGEYAFDNMRAWNRPQYEDPYPLYDSNYPDTTGKYFLCSRMVNPSDGQDNPLMGIYLIDIFGNEILLHTDSKGCYDPMPLAVRERPATRPTMRNYGISGTGKVYVYNVYEGTHMKGVQPGAVKYLRIVEATEKLTRAMNGWGGQGAENPAMAWHDFYSKKILGTVPVEADGSAYFEIPAETFVYFQLLDEKGMMIQSMRSGTVVQSGELAGCLGCHESRTDAVPTADNFSYLPIAIQRNPSPMNGWYGKTKEFNYLDDVQPVFTAKCTSCHGYDTVGGAKANLLLEPDKCVFFNTSYNELWRKRYTGAIGAGPAQIQQAYSWGSHASRLVTALGDLEHTGVSLTPEEFDRIVTWVDINAPYYPVYTTAYPYNRGGRSPLNESQLASLSSLTGVSFSNIWYSNTGPHLSFDRPAKSPCLNGLSMQAFINALNIINAGQSNLLSNPRADMPGHVPCAADQLRLDKWDWRRGIELQNRQAVREGWKNYD